MYKEFMDFIKSKQTQDNTPPSYSSAVTEEGNENIEVYDKNEKDEVILLLEPIDLQWKEDPWQIMNMYFDTTSYVVPAYKYRMHYEIILSSIGLAEFQHFYSSPTKKVYNFSKFIIKKIFTPQEWGLSTMKEESILILSKKLLLGLIIGIMWKVLIKHYYMRMLIKSIRGS